MASQAGAKREEALDSRRREIRRWEGNDSLERNLNTSIRRHLCNEVVNSNKSKKKRKIQQQGRLERLSNQRNDDDGHADLRRRRCTLCVSYTSI